MPDNLPPLQHHLQNFLDCLPGSEKQEITEAIQLYASTAIDAALAARGAVPADGFTVNFVRLAGLDKHTARKCEEIVREVLAAAPQQVAQPSDLVVTGRLDALAELCAMATGGWDLPASTTQRIGILASRAAEIIRAQAKPKQAAQPTDNGLDADEGNPVRLWAEIHRLRAAVDGPSGYATWQDAATAERVRRVRISKAGEALVSAYREKYKRTMGDIRSDAPLREQFTAFNAALQTPAAPQPKD